jgi:enoyl-CoA hydratase/carnithine racemase
MITEAAEQGSGNIVKRTCSEIARIRLMPTKDAGSTDVKLRLFRINRSNEFSGPRRSHLQLIPKHRQYHRAIVMVHCRPLLCVLLDVRACDWEEMKMSEKDTNGGIRLLRESREYWRVTLDIPPINIFGPANIPQLEEIVSSLESDPQVKVVVFESAVEGFFLTHYDFLADPEESAKFPVGRTGLQALPDMLARLSRASVVSIASIRGRATGVGSELALASDMRFASREKAVLSQWEVGAGLVPGGGPMARLPRLIGRGRALEVLLGADDVNGDLAELYGYVNRSLPDNQLDAFVDALARRISTFDRQAIAETKRLVNRNSLPSDAEIVPEWDAFTASLGRPAAQARLRALFEKGFHKPGDVENRLGFHVGTLDPIAQL